MTRMNRTLAVLALAGAISQTPACDENSDSSGSDAGSSGSSESGGTGGKATAGTGGKGGSGGSGGKGGSGGSSESGGSGGKGGSGGSGGSAAADSCPKDDHITANEDKKVCEIHAPKGDEIKKDLTLPMVDGYKGYVLDGVVYVGEDVGGDKTPASGKAMATLTIKPGVHIAGLDQSSGLAINRGSKLDAEGTKDDPIVFTSLKALIPGSDKPAPTDWGGVVLMGRAKQNAGDEPVTELDTGNYGGVIDDDNSGKLKYVRVEFSGSRSSTEKEFNGISFYAIGSGTEVDYVQVHAGSDDGVEFFGGTVNVKHLVISGPGDDSVDWTDGFRGKLQYVVARQVPNFGDNGIEADNHNGGETNEPISEPTIANITLLGQTSANGSDGPFGMLLRRGTKVHLYSLIATNFKNGCVNVDGDTTGAFVGTDNLTIMSSRILCDNLYTGKGEDFFKSDDSNKVLDSADVLDGFLPKSDSGLLTGGKSPDDGFFDKVDFIGAFGTDDWTEGWTDFPDFEPK